MKIALFTPAYGQSVHPDHVHTLMRDIVWAMGEDHQPMWFWHDVQPIDRSRNMAVQRAREAGADLLYMLDADVYAAPTGSVLEHLVTTMREQRATVTAAVVMSRTGTEVNVEPARAFESYECDKIGTAMMLIDLHKLGELEQPPGGWFQFRLLPDGIGIAAGEDVGFCQAVRSQGHRVVADFRIPTRHVSSVPLAVEKFVTAAAAGQTAE